jgi:pimeloyl-ACP methyl ester carboxylesterase
MPKRILGVLMLAALIYGGFLIVVTGFQSSLIYYPGTATEAQMLSIAEAWGMEPWRDGDGAIVGWKDSAADSIPEDVHYALVFHGNAGHAMHRGYYRNGLRALSDERVQWRTFIFEYPGYGARAGRPSEEAFKRAADEALRSLLEETGGAPIYLIGESLGSGVASHLAGKYPDAISGILLVTPFTTLAEVGAKHYPFLPVGWLLRDNYDNRSALTAYNGPLAVLLAESDQVVPAELGRRLYDHYDGPKRLWVQAGRGHNNLDFNPSADWWSEAFRFLTQSPASGRPE